MKLNEEKLDQMVKAVMKVFYPAPTKEICDRKQYEDEAKSIRTALTPFAMEMTDEEIIKEGEERSYLFDEPTFYEIGFKQGAKFIRDGK